MSVLIINNLTILLPTVIPKTTVETDEELLLLIIITSVISACIFNLLFSIAYIVIVKYRKKKNSLIEFILGVNYILTRKEMLISLIISLIILLIAVFCIKIYDNPYRYYYNSSGVYTGIVITFVCIGMIIFALMLAILQKINLILYICVKKIRNNNRSLSNV